MDKSQFEALFQDQRQWGSKAREQKVAGNLLLSKGIRSEKTREGIYHKLEKAKLA